MTTKLEGKSTRFLPFNLGHNLGKGNPPEPRRTQDLVPVGAGLGARTPGWTSCTASSTSSGPTRGRSAARRAAETVIFPRYHQWDAVHEAGGRRGGERRRALLPDPALGRVGQVQHDRLAGAPALDAARRRGPQGVRQGRRDHRPRDPRPPAPGHDLPVRARPRRGREDRRGLGPARRGAGGRAGADHHHDAAEVPVRARQDRGRCPRADYAVIIDEAHSSQTGEAAKDLRLALGRRRGAGADRGRGRGRRAARRRRSIPSRRRLHEVRRRAQRPAVEPLLLRVHRDAEGPDAGDVRPPEPGDGQVTSRSTSTRCARRSRRASSSTCSPTTRPTRRSGRSRRRPRKTPSTTPRRRAARSRGSSACIPITSRRRPRSSSSTSASTPPRRWAGSPRRWS